MENYYQLGPSATLDPDQAQGSEQAHAGSKAGSGAPPAPASCPGGSSTEVLLHAARARALTDLLDQVLEEPCYNTLRTQVGTQGWFPAAGWVCM